MRMILSCISYQLSTLKREWAKSRQETSSFPDVLGRLEKPPEEQDGFVCIIDETGAIHQSLRLWMPTGVLVSETHLLIAGPWSVHRVASDLSHVDKHVFTSPWFNSLHSIVQTKAGFLVTSTGLDLLLEFDQNGKVLWSWWASDHELNLTPRGMQRYTKRAADHRGTFYGTAAHTTHINSAVELANGDILASLFHQGMVIYIQRKNGHWKPLLESLDHPHSIRLQGEDHFTVADTGHGRALLVKLLPNEKSSIEKEINLSTKWLADCCYDKELHLWWLLDAEHSRIIIFEEDSEKYTYIVLDPELRLYAIEPLVNV